MKGNKRKLTCTGNKENSLTNWLAKRSRVTNISMDSTIVQEYLNKNSSTPTTASTDSISANLDCASENLQHTAEAAPSDNTNIAADLISDKVLRDDNVVKNEYVKKFLVNLHVNGRHFVRCKPCYEQPEIVRLHSRKNKLPPIVQETGTIFRSAVVNEHFLATHHLEAVKAYNLSLLSKQEKRKVAPILKTVAKVNADYENKIGKLLVHAYCDGKRLTLSGNSFPARVAASKIAEHFSSNQTIKEIIESNKLDLQYVSPNGHHDILETIVRSDRDRLKNKLANDVLAISIRCDGSVDRTQEDKIYTTAKIVTKKRRRTGHLSRS